MATRPLLERCPVPNLSWRTTPMPDVSRPKSCLYRRTLGTVCWVSPDSNDERLQLVPVGHLSQIGFLRGMYENMALHGTKLRIRQGNMWNANRTNTY